MRGIRAGRLCNRGAARLPRKSGFDLAGDTRVFPWALAAVAANNEWSGNGVGGNNNPSSLCEYLSMCCRASSILTPYSGRERPRVSMAKGRIASPTR